MDMSLTKNHLKRGSTIKHKPIYALKNRLCIQTIIVTQFKTMKREKTDD